MQGVESSPYESADRVRLVWFTTARWTTVLAGVGAVVAGRAALQGPENVWPATIALLACAASNVWLAWRARRVLTHALFAAAPVLMCADIALLSWLLVGSGGVLNPASVFYLVEIVVAALVFGRRWTWAIASLAVLGYAALFLAPTEDLRAAQVMHPEISLHMRGMWLAFALTAIIIAALVSRLTVVIERRDRSLATLRQRNERVFRAASLATLAAGAAHELSTPLSTIAVAARELQRTINLNSAEAVRDAELIRAETDRCRAILDAMAAQSGDPAGEPPERTSLQKVVELLEARMKAADRSRLDTARVSDQEVIWPVRVIVRALGNLLDNAFQASPLQESSVSLAIDGDRERIRITVRDRGEGMTSDQLTRAGEPFFTTKPAGQGTGLGLFVARSTIEQLGGALTLSSSPGQGTTAVVDVPRNVLTGQQQTS